MTSIIKGGVMIKEFAQSATIGASATLGINFDIEVSGYKPIGIVGWNAIHSRVACTGLSFNDTTAYMALVNTYSGALTGNPSIKILYTPK